MSTTTSIYTTRSRYPALLFPTAWYYYYLATDRLFDDFGVKFEKVGMIIEDNMRRDMYYPISAAIRFQKNFIQKILTESHFLENIKEQLLIDGEKILKFIQQHEIIVFDALSDDELMAVYKEYNDLYTNFNYPAIVIVVVGTEGLIQEVQNIITNQSEFDILSKSSTLPYLLQYKLDILEASIDDIDAIHKKWYWIPFDYYGADEWDKMHFLNELKKPKDVKRMAYLKNYQTITLRNQKEILENKSLSLNEKKLVNALPTLNFIQDERKRVTNLSYPFLHKKIFNEFARRLDVPKEIVWLMTPDEIRKGLSGEKKDFAYRKKKCVLEVFEDNFTTHETFPPYISLEMVDESTESIKGVTASGGKTSGRVKVCISSKEVSQMRQGEILVAPATTPDYILGFKKASAVITDEGGLTSHAAVVSREMKLPCIIGTKTASKILKDGDLVEVDANNGIVKILERKKREIEN